LSEDIVLYGLLLVLTVVMAALYQDEREEGYQPRRASRLGRRF
jgi:hypothetical protein